MERYCTTIGQSKLLLSLGYKEETADLYYIPKVGGYFISEDKAPNSIPAWSLPRLIELMPESFDFEDWELTIWKGGCVQYLWNRSGRERLSEDYIWGDCDMEEIGTGYVANCVKCLKWVKENDYVPNIPWKEDDFIKREVWLRVSFKKAVTSTTMKGQEKRMPL